MFGSLIRRIGFWMQDFCRGGKIRKNYNNIKQIMKNRINNLEQLNNILSYAKNNVPYYSKIKECKLENFPIVSKHDFMEKNDKLKSQEFLNKKNLHHVETSGSTGVPFKAVQDITKRNRVVASLIYFHKKAGFNLGDKYMFLRAWTSNYSNSKIKMIMQNYISINVIRNG